MSTTVSDKEAKWYLQTQKKLNLILKGQPEERLELLEAQIRNHSLDLEEMCKQEEQESNKEAKSGLTKEIKKLSNIQERKDLEVVQLKQQVAEVATYREEIDEFLKTKMKTIKIDGELSKKVEQAKKLFNDVNRERKKWNHCILLGKSAKIQMGNALTEWSLLKPQQDTNKKSKIVYNTKNLLHVGHANITKAQILLKNIQFPYCTPKEMQSMSNTIHSLENIANSNHDQIPKVCESIKYLNCKCDLMINWASKIVDDKIQCVYIDYLEQYKGVKKEMNEELEKEIIKIAGVSPENVDITSGNESSSVPLPIEKHSSDKTDKNKLEDCPTYDELFGDDFIEQEQMFKNQNDEFQKNTLENQYRAEENLEKLMEDRMKKRKQGKK
ncbi:hypothetical protein SNEBB_010342 [Seison nebaliae]|nr:hypothetical protein SNEBB_010342 [Seison nebaliae]